MGVIVDTANAELCSYYYPNLENLVLNCTHRQLSKIPENVWPNQHYLEKISVSFSKNVFEYLEPLPAATEVDQVYISLSNCQIRNIINETFIHVENITSLDLSFNFLSGK